MTSKDEKMWYEDRLGHNDPSGQPPTIGRITYLAHAKGYVMARRPGCTPFVISEKLWRSFPYWDSARAQPEKR